MKERISKVLSYLAYDSRGIPTIMTEVFSSSGHVGRFFVPSGSSKGSKEACELRDGTSQNNGFSVNKCIEKINGSINDSLVDTSIEDIQEIDLTLMRLDGTQDKSFLGANTILSVSCASVACLSRCKKQPLYKTVREIYCSDVSSGYRMPVPLVNIINGGMHANSGVSIQEFMLVPIGFSSFRDAVRAVSEIQYEMKCILCDRGFSVSVGDEGGVSPTMKTKDILDLLVHAISLSGYSLDRVRISLDLASSSFYKEGFYCIDEEKFTTNQFIDYIEDLNKIYSFFSIEDPLHEEDVDGWVEITKRLSKQSVRVVGDDLFVTNSDLLRKGCKKGMADSILIKLNQIGTYTETVETCRTADKCSYPYIISHRSGETEDTFIADLSVGLSNGFIKTGSLCRSERVAKYNRILYIESVLGRQSFYSV